MTTAKTETTTEAPQGPRAFEQCGALWQRVDKLGKVYLGGNIEIGVNKIKLLIFDYTTDAASLTVKRRADDGGENPGVGTLQRDSSEKTPLFYRGILEIGGAQLRIFAFPNKRKTADKQPDWQICVPGAGFVDIEPDPEPRAPASDKHPSKVTI